jgi:hypothetical protein
MLRPGAIITLLFFSLLAFRGRTQNCGPIDRTVQGYTFIDPQLIGLEAASVPFSLRFGDFSRFYGDNESVKETDNVTEWWERFCEYPEKEDVKTVIYSTPINQLVRLLNAIHDNEEIADFDLAANTFARYLKTHRCTETINYLIFAKKCEPHCKKLGDPWQEQKRDPEEMRRLINEGLEAFRRTKSYYLRLRYAYQIVRLAHYAQDFEQAIELYDYCRPKMDNHPSIIDYWLLGHKAGALMALGKNVEASYLYSLIFENCPSKRESAYLSFRINNDEEWRQCLNLCKDDHERATLYAIRAGHADSRALEEMRYIYDLDPTNRHLENLLFREVKKLEKRLLGLGFREQAGNKFNPRDSSLFWAGRYVIDLQAFASRLAEEKKVKNPELWKIAEGYLEVLAGNYYQARKTLAEARAMTRNSPVQNQIEIFELALQISDFSEVTDSVENAAARIIRSNEWYQIYRDFPDLLYDKLATLYDESKDPGKAFLCRYTLQELRPNPQPDILDNLIEICQSPNRNRMEDELVETEPDQTIINDLLDIKATYFLSRFQLEAALETYKKMPREKWGDYGFFNPFVERFHDCVKCALPDNVPTYNKGELIERILDLEYQAKAQPERSDSIYYQIGLAFYNMTYFGQAWKLTDYYRGWDSVRRGRLQDGGEVEVINVARFPFGNRETFDCTQAEYFFNLARIQADDPEFAAKAAYMAAKCERNEYYVNRTSGVERTFKYFDMLRDQYNNTEYYKELSERGRCKTFIAYLQK